MVNVDEIIGSILARVESGCELKDALWIELSRYRIEEETGEIAISDMKEVYLKRFIAIKRFEGRSEKTLMQYMRENRKLVEVCGKDPTEVTRDDIVRYLAQLQTKGNKMVSVVNAKRYIASFYNWMDDEGYIPKSPARNIKAIKCPKTERVAFTSCEIDQLKSHVTNIRDRAIIELLLSTGCRVGELVLLNISDLKWNEKEICVKGKGNKERVVYYTDVTGMYLKQYLETRNDHEPALFVTRRHNRMEIATVERMIRELGRKANVEAYPHKFRRTFATRALQSGMAITSLSKLMGHDKIETTMMYCDINKSQLQLAYFQHIEV